MQQDKPIETILQQLESQQLPDLSRMDAHWQQLQAMLHPAPADKPQHRAKPWLILAACLLLCSLVTLLLVRTGSNKSSTANAETTKKTAPALADTMPAATISGHGDTLKLVYPQAMLRRPPVLHLSGKKIVAQPRRTDTVYFNLNFINCKDSAVTAAPAAMPEAERQQRLQLLFAQLEKKPETMVIDNRYDTVLTCKEGTALQIPAGSLGGHAKVLFSVKEIYKKRDMVLNQLTATSNKALLESGGMLQLTATVNDQPVDVAPGRSITVYMTDTSSYMQQMQLFTGEKITETLPGAVVRFNEKMEDITNGAASTYMNWIPQYQYFARSQTVQHVRILYLGDEEAKVTATQRGLKATFLRSAGSNFSKKELKQMLQDRYGDTYYKIKIRNQRRKKMLSSNDNGEYFAVGDSVWVDKQQADKNKWPYSNIRNTAMTDFISQAVGIDTTASIKMNKALQSLDKRYGINISKLGWINCDRFYGSKEEKVDYVVQLGDAGANYYTLLVLHNINAVMNSYVSGNTAIFTGVPSGMEATVVSVGINKNGEAVYAIQKGTTNKAGLSGISYQPADAAALPNALSKLDQ